jgi:hypothetical protein
MTTRVDRKRKRTPKWLRITLFILLIGLIGGGAYLYNVYNTLLKQWIK